MLYLDNESFEKFPYQLLKALSFHPQTDFKILDSLMFILKYPDIVVAKKDAEEG